MTKRADRHPSDSYPPIDDYALIGDCHTAALVSRTGSIDWCCLPRFDSGSTFGRLLDRHHGGHFEITPADGAVTSLRRYLDDSLVLLTTFEGSEGRAQLYDFFAITDDRKSAHRHLVRIVEGIRGTVEFAMRFQPRFDFGEVEPWLRHHGDRFYSAVGGNDAVVLWSDTQLAVDGDHDLTSSFTARGGTRNYFSMTWDAPEEIDPKPRHAVTVDELDRALEITTSWWQRWAATAVGATESAMRRSAIVLKALTYEPTGAVVAAATASLPEEVSGTRNWDYRFSWVRDSQFTVRSLGEVGCDDEADAFRRFIERSAAGNADGLQIMYGVGGERRLTELTLDALEGYAGSQPVRIGNAAAKQTQHDVYGYLLDLAWRWHQRGQSPDDDYWRFLVSLVNAACRCWHEPDRGIWEIRGDKQHFVHSKAMCWVALNRGIQLAEACMRTAPLREWERARDEIRDAIERRGVDKKRNVFVRSFGSDDLDAALLLLPAFDFVAYDDPRMVATADAVADELTERGLVRRYRSKDGLHGREGTFVACTFWLVENLAHQGRLTEAQKLFDRGVATANDVGLFAEEYDAKSDRLLGNLPQGLSHLSHLTAALAIARSRGAD